MHVDANYARTVKGLRGDGRDRSTVNIGCHQERDADALARRYIRSVAALNLRSAMRTSTNVVCEKNPRTVALRCSHQCGAAAHRLRLLPTHPPCISAAGHLAVQHPGRTERRWQGALQRAHAGGRRAV